MNMGVLLIFRYKRGTREEEWLKIELRRLICGGYVRAVQEGQQPVFHIMDRFVGNPYGPAGAAPPRPPAQPVAPATPRPQPSPALAQPPTGPRAPEIERGKLRFVRIRSNSDRDLKKAIRDANVLNSSVYRVRNILGSEANVSAFAQRIRKYLRDMFRGRDRAIGNSDEIAVGLGQKGPYVVFKRAGNSAVLSLQGR